MRIGSEAPKRRTHSSSRHESQGTCRDSATSNRHRRLVTSGRTRPKLWGAFSVLHSLCRTQNNAVWYNALPHKPPQGDQNLARQGHDHGLASTASVLGAGSKPPRQGAVLLVQKEPPCQLNHASSDSSIARTGQIEFTTATLHIRRVKQGSPSTHPILGDELRALRRLQREQEPKSPFVFTSERGAPFSTAGFARMVERAGREANLAFKAHPHMLRHACGYEQIGR